MAQKQRKAVLPKRRFRASEPPPPLTPAAVGLEIPGAPCRVASSDIRGLNSGRCAPLRPVLRSQSKIAPSVGGRSSRIRVGWTRNSNTRHAMAGFVRGRPHGHHSPPVCRRADPELARFVFPDRVPSSSRPGPPRSSSPGMLLLPPPPESTGGCEPLVRFPRRPPRGPGRNPGRSTKSACGGAETGVRASLAHGNPFGI